MHRGGQFDRLADVQHVGAATADFAVFVRDSAQSLYGTAWVLCGDADAAEELVQETLATAFARWPRIAAATSPLAYVRRSLVNRFIDSHRGPRAMTRPVPVLPDRPVGGDVASEVTTSALVRHLLSELPPRQAAALTLRYLYGWPDRDTAAALGCRTPTVRSLVRRGLSAARIALSEQEAVDKLGTTPHASPHPGDGS